MNESTFYTEINEARKQGKTLLDNWLKAASKGTQYIFKDDKALAQSILIKLNRAYLNAISGAHLNKSEKALKSIFNKYEKIIDKSLDSLTK